MVAGLQAHAQPSQAAGAAISRGVGGPLAHAAPRNPLCKQAGSRQSRGAPVVVALVAQHLPHSEQHALSIQAHAAVHAAVARCRPGR